jgi:hypothetical protein
MSALESIDATAVRRAVVDPAVQPGDVVAVPDFAAGARCSIATGEPAELVILRKGRGFRVERVIATEAGFGIRGSGLD